eukprot:Colp12_sorted_trinity150504_noHs@10555
MRGLFVAVLLAACAIATLGSDAEYEIGVGIHDVTGPAADINLMGYAMPYQIVKGIHLRLRSRAYIFAEPNNGKRVVFVSADICMVSQLVKMQVVAKLKELYNGLYTDDNVVLSGTHTHSGPAGYHQYVLFDITSFGFVKESLIPIVEGIVASIVEAHESMRPANIFTAAGELLEANINRSPSAYLFNPPEERAKYKYDVDKEMTLLKITDAEGNGMGSINWFPVHCTSMNNTNRLISSDNKGFASYLFEKEMNKGSLPGEGPFVAAFAQSNEGDVSPNTRGPVCQDTGLPCEMVHSTCNGRTELCWASGPGRDMVESTEIIGRKQYEKARELYDQAATAIKGPVDYVHVWMDFTNVTVALPDGSTGKTCKPAMGYAFAAGTTDGPGAFNFVQSTTTPNPFWNALSYGAGLNRPSKEQKECQSPKPILLNTGELSWPYLWHPHVVPMQIARVGQLFIVAVPGEFTTMSGRRMRDAVKAELIAQGAADENAIVVIAGLSNTYTHYIATYEEYHAQRYEGASTIFGPNTLAAYIQEYRKLAVAMAKGLKVASPDQPPNLLDKQWSFVPPVVVDEPPLGKHFGTVAHDVAASYKRGDTVTVSFYSACPRNNPRVEDSFLKVERLDSSTNTWQLVAVDGHWETTYRFSRPVVLSPHSTVEITWAIPEDAEPGTYRIRHFGDSKNVLGHISQFEGQSSSFSVV